MNSTKTTTYMEKYKKLLVPASIVLVVILIGITLFFIIKNKKEKDKYFIDPQYAEYVSAITSGVISCESTIKVVLVEPFKGDSLGRIEAIKDIFSFSPDVSGTARWFDDKTIEFVPDKKLQSGEQYEVKFKLKKVANVPSKLGTLTFSFWVIKQDFSVSDEGLRTYPDKSDMYFLEGNVKTADVSDNEAIEQLISASIQGNKFAIKWEHAANRTEHKYTVDSITRTSENQVLTVDWDGAAINVDKTGKNELEIPAIGVFKVLDAKQISGNESYLKIIFSDPIDATQNLDGLITIDNLSDLRFNIEDNIVKVYYSNAESQSESKLVVSEGVLNYKGEKLKERYVKGLMLQQIKPAVEIIGKGVIMPNSGSITLPFRAVNLKSVDVTVIQIFEKNIPQFLQVNSLTGMRELKRVGRPVFRKKIDLVSDHVIDYSLWNTFSIDLSSYIKTEPGALYRVTFAFKKAYSLYPCEGDSSTSETINETELAVNEQDDFSDWDISDNDSYYDDYEYYYEEGVYEEENYWENRDNPCSKAYYYRDRMPGCNVLASNLGLIAKMNKNNELNIIVTDINTAKPLSGIAVDVLDYQQQVITTTTTNSDGFANVKADHRPYLLIAKRDKERGYLTLNGNASLSLTTFDVNGDEVQKGLKGFIYGERGVWRPGDTLFLTFVLEDKNKTLPANHPVIFELTDPKGRLFKRQVKTSSTNGFYTFITPTEEKSPTGNWNVKVRAGGAIFNKTIKIETIKPNRLEINLDFTGGKEFLESSIQGSINAKWLHGALASNLDARITAILSASTTTFKSYPDYVFDDPTRTCTSEEKVIFDSKLDDAGKANISTTLSTGSEAPGMLKVGFITKVFEESGDFSIDYVSYPFSPYDYYVGIKTPEGHGWGDMLYTDTTNILKIATVDVNGNPVSRSNIEVKIYKLEWRWWWDASDDDLASYFANNYHSPVISKTISTHNGSGQFGFKINENEYGRYLILVKDADGHASGKTVYLDWPGWYNRSGENSPGGASILSISTDKKQYKVGEKAKVTIPSNGNGRALVSLESGSRIIDMYWVELDNSKDNRAVVEIPVTDEMAPNVFINVTILQPHANTKNDAPIRLYGYTPMLVEDPGTILEPIISLPDVVGSEEQFNVAVKEKNGKPMTYTLAVVDEGLLGLTRFKTPDPHSTFYAREALGIKTWDIFDLVFGAFGGKVEQVFGIGGDQEMAGAKQKKDAERFKPVVRFLGPFTLKKGDKNNHSVKLPKYNGAVRVMLVAGENAAYGFTEKKVKVKNALMVMATMPRVLGPGETVTMPVTVFADDPSVKNVSIELQANSMLIPIDGKSRSISFSKPGNGIVTFSMKVPKMLGVAKVKVLASSGKNKASYDVELNVRNPNPIIYQYSGTIIQPSQSYKDNLNMVGMVGTNKATIEVSSLPPMDLGRRLNYLIQYPHGCIEQTTSGVFPQLYLNDLLDLPKEKVDKMEENVKAGINRIKGFQTSEGGLSYWPGENESNEWASNYGGHFMIEAEMMGYKLPAGFKQGWIKYQQIKARNSTGEVNWYYYSDQGLTQAYRLYTLALAQQPEMGAMNRLRERANNSVQTRWMLAAAYIKAGQPEVAKELTNSLSTNITPYSELGYTYGSYLRDKAMILETYSLLKNFTKGTELAESIAKQLSSDEWYSTHTLGYCLIAMAKFADASGMSKGNVDFAYSIDNSSSASVNALKSIYQITPDVKNKEKINVIINNKSKGALYTRFYLEGIPVAGTDDDASNNMTLQIVYKDLNGNTLNIENLKQGTDFKADITVRNLSNTEYYQNIALTQIVPSGWEIINTRLGDIESASSSVLPDYLDIRDDRILSYFNLKKGEAKTFSYLFNASYLGEYYLPTITCEAMYDHKIYARKAGKWVKVVK
jgi:uncharacterized protein YfaS (alpha-2-macroglobulin family)